MGQQQQKEMSSIRFHLPGEFPWKVCLPYLGYLNLRTPQDYATRKPVAQNAFQQDVRQVFQSRLPATSLQRLSPLTPRLFLHIHFALQDKAVSGQNDW